MATNFQSSVANVLAARGLNLETELIRMRDEGKSAASMALEIHMLSGGLMVVTGPTVALWAAALPVKAEAEAS